MPASDRPDRSSGSDGRSLEEELAGLEAAVERLLSEYDRLRERGDRTEAAYEELREALSDASIEGLDPRDLESRLRELVEENRRYREIIEEGRERAERIQSRLMVMEDEA